MTENVNLLGNPITVPTQSIGGHGPAPFNRVQHGLLNKDELSGAKNRMLVHQKVVVTDYFPKIDTVSFPEQDFLLEQINANPPIPGDSVWSIMMHPNSTQEFSAVTAVQVSAYLSILEKCSNIFLEKLFASNELELSNKLLAGLFKIYENKKFHSKLLLSQIGSPSQCNDSGDFKTIVKRSAVSVKVSFLKKFFHDFNTIFAGIQAIKGIGNVELWEDMTEKIKKIIVIEKNKQTGKIFSEFMQSIKSLPWFLLSCFSIDACKFRIHYNGTCEATKHNYNKDKLSFYLIRVCYYGESELFCLSPERKHGANISYYFIKKNDCSSVLMLIYTSNTDYDVIIKNVLEKDFQGCHIEEAGPMYIIKSRISPLDFGDKKNIFSILQIPHKCYKINGMQLKKRSDLVHFSNPKMRTWTCVNLKN
jgi:hypothetical protein